MTRRTTTVRFRDVPWEEVQGHLVSGISSEFWWERVRGTLTLVVAVPVKAVAHHPYPKACDGPLWISVEYNGALGDSAALCPHLIEVD